MCKYCEHPESYCRFTVLTCLLTTSQTAGRPEQLKSFFGGREKGAKRMVALGCILSEKKTAVLQSVLQHTVNSVAQIREDERPQQHPDPA